MCKVCANKYWFAQFTVEVFSKLVGFMVSYGHVAKNGSVLALNIVSFINPYPANVENMVSY